MPNVKIFTCEECGRDFEHPVQRGRPPKRCPKHRVQAQPKPRKTTDPPTKAELKDIARRVEKGEIPKVKVIPPKGGSIPIPYRPTHNFSTCDDPECKEVPCAGWWAMQKRVFGRTFPSDYVGVS